MVSRDQQGWRERRSQSRVTRKRNKYTRIADTLRERAKQEGSLPPVLDAYKKLLGLQMETKSRIKAEPPHLDQEAATSRLRQGQILLSYDDLSLDWILAADLFRAVGQFTVDNITSEAGDVASFASMASDSQCLQQAVGDWYNGKPLDPVADKYSISRELLSSAIQATLYPFLVTRAGALQKLVQQEIWRRRQCPICGGKPDFAFLDKDRGARWLLCSRCDTEWLFQRLECPYCGTQSNTALAYYADKEGLYRLYTCQECRSYIKAVDLRKTSREKIPVLERVLTWEMDRQGVQEGFRPGQA